MKNNTLWDIYMKSYDKLLPSLHAYRVLVNDMCRHAITYIRKIKKKNIYILEAGCGTGNILNKINGLRHEVPGKNMLLTGIDKSNVALKAASNKMKGKYKLFKCDLVKTRLGLKDKNYKYFTRNPYDLIIINNVLFALSDNEKMIFFEEIRKIISETGILIISEPHANAALYNLLREELIHSGNLGIVQLLLKGTLFLHLAKIVLINLVFFTKNSFFCSEKQKTFITRAGLYLVEKQLDAYGGNNEIHIYKKTD